MTALTLKASDRGILVGANGTGKSTLANYIVSHFRADYPHGRILVLDTKPRWRGERRADGTSTKRLYRKLSEGDTIPGSVTISQPHDWALAWDRDANPVQTVIAQRIKGSHRENVAFQVGCAERFFDSLDFKRPSLIYFDEGHDFFTATSSAIGGSDIVQRGYRAGRERGLASLIGVQRPKGFNPQCLTETNYCALFRINFRKDMAHLYDMGFPQSVGPPSYADAELHRFRLWREGSETAPMYALSQSSDERSQAA